MDLIEVRLLGAFSVRWAGRSVIVRTQKTRALLAYLARHLGRSFTRAALAGLLWPESDSRRAAHSLRQALSELRGALAPQADAPGLPLALTRHEVTLAPAEHLWIDAAAFETALPFEHDTPPASRAEADNLTNAAALYQGDLLEGFFLDDASEFETWLVTDREHLKVRALALLEQLADYHAARGEYARAQAHLVRALALDPWHEAAHRALMRVQALSGNPAAAVAQYEKARAALAAGLGVEPLEATQAIYRQVLAGAQTLVPQRAFSRTAPRPEALFVGRGAEHARLALALAGRQLTPIPVGQPVFSLLEGEAGTGKTRLVDEFGRYAASQGATVITGRCFEFGECVPYQPIAEALRAALAAGHLDLDTLTPVWRAELARLLPELATGPAQLAAPGPMARDETRQRLFAAVWQCLRGLSGPRRPVLLFLDDLHWADQASLDLLHYLVRQAMAAPVLFIGAYRPEETPAGHPLRHLRHGLSRDGLVQVIPIPALSLEDVSAICANLLEARTGHPASRADELATYLLSESEGNPFVLTETLNGLYETAALTPNRERGWRLTTLPKRSELALSAGVSSTILRRVERLPSVDQAALHMAATIGRPFDRALLCAAAGTDSALETWLDHRLVRPLAQPNTFDFAHDNIRAVVYRDLPPARRQVLHGRVAAALERLHAAELDREAAALAHHYRLSDEPRQAWPHLRTAARQAGRALAFGQVVTLCDQALALDPDDATVRFDFLDLRQRAHQFLGQTEAEGQDADAMRQLADVTAQPSMRATAGERLALFYARRGDMTRAREAMETAVAAARESGAPVLEIKTLVPLTMLLRDSPEGQARGLEMLTYALEQARASGNPVEEAYVLGHLGTVQGERGDLGEAIATFERSLALLRAAGDGVYLANCWHSLAGTYRLVGQYDRAETALNQALAFSRRHDLKAVQLPLRLGFGKLCVERGDGAGARSHFEAACDLAHEFQRPMLAAEGELGLGQAALLLADYTTAVRHLTLAAEKLAPAERRLWGQALGSLALALLGLGDAASARIRSEAAMGWAESGAAPTAELCPILHAHAAVLAACGETGAADAVRARGQALVLEQAQRLPDELRASYLKNVAVNRWLLATAPGERATQ